MSDSDDVRGGERHTASLRIRLKFSDEAHFIERYSANISRGGIFVATRTPKDVGTWLRFEFQLEGGQTVIRGEGSVAWVSRFDPAQPERPYGMGVRFDKLDEASKKVIERALTWKAARRRAAEARKQRREGPPEEATRRVDLDDMLKLSRRSAREELTAAASGERAPEGPAPSAAPTTERRPPTTDERTRVGGVTPELLAAGGEAVASRAAPGAPAPAPPTPTLPAPAPPGPLQPVAAPSPEPSTTSAAAPARPEAAPTPTARVAPDDDDDDDDEDDDSDADATPLPVVELEAEPGDAEEDLPPLPLPPPVALPRAVARRPAAPLPVGEPAASSTPPEPGEPQPLPPPPLEELAPRDAGSRTGVLGRVKIVPGRSAGRRAPIVEVVAARGTHKARRPQGGGPEPAPDQALDELLVAFGIDDAQLAEVTARARAQTAPLVDKLSGDAGELDWLLDPPRPEPLPTPAQARSLLDRWLSARAGRR